MKKEKAKTQSKKAKKELEDKLVAAFTAVVGEYGKAKKTKAVIEKFAKQLRKKVDMGNRPEIVAVETVVPVSVKAVKVKTVKKVVEPA